MFQSAAILTVPLTVAVHALKKPCIYKGFINLNTEFLTTDETRLLH